MGAGVPRPCSAKRANASTSPSTPARIIIAPMPRVSSRPRNGGRSCQPVIDHGTSPATVHGTTTKTTAEPRTAIVRCSAVPDTRRCELIPTSSSLRLLTGTPSTSSHPITLSNGFCQPDRPANRAAAHSHQRQQTRQQRCDRVQTLLLDCKVEQGKRHGAADHMTREGLCSEQARWTFSKKLLHFFPPRDSSPCRYSRRRARPR